MRSPHYAERRPARELQGTCPVRQTKAIEKGRNAMHTQRLVGHDSCYVEVL